MADSPRHRSDRYSRSPSPRDRTERSRSRSPSRRSPPPRERVERSRSRSPSRRFRHDALNPGNNLYVTGLSTRVNEKDLEEHFSREGKVLECRLVLDPRTRESRGFGFVTMEHLEDAERCIKYLNRSTLEGRMITVEKRMTSPTFSRTAKNPFFRQIIAKRKRARTPTPGEYLGVRAMQSNRRGGRGGGGGGGGGGGYRREGRNSRHSPEYAPYSGGRDRSPRYSPYRGHQRDRSASPQYAPYRR